MMLCLFKNEFAVLSVAVTETVIFLSLIEVKVQLLSVRWEGTSAVFCNEGTFISWIQKMYLCKNFNM